MFGVDDVNFAHPDDRVCKWCGIIDVLVFITIKSEFCTKAPVDEARNDPDGVLIK